MSKNNYNELVKSLKLPTEEQVVKFTEWIFGAFDWYKYAHLFKGADIVVFIDPYVERGFDHSFPRFHGWRTREEYFQMYGSLGFLYRMDEGDKYSVEGRSEDLGFIESLGFDLPEIFFNSFHFKIYPYTKGKLGETYATRHKDNFVKLHEKEHKTDVDKMLIEWESYLLETEELRYKKMTDEESEEFRGIIRNAGMGMQYSRLPLEKMSMPVQRGSTKNIQRTLKLYIEKHNIIHQLFKMQQDKLHKTIQEMLNYMEPYLIE